MNFVILHLSKIFMNYNTYLKKRFAIYFLPYIVDLVSKQGCKAIFGHVCIASHVCILVMSFAHVMYKLLFNSSQLTVVTLIKHVDSKKSTFFL